MATNQEYAWMSAAAYNGESGAVSEIMEPPTWVPLQAVDGSRSPNGFGATAFRNTQSGEVVIAFEGTNALLTRSFLRDNFLANFPLAGGNYSSQLTSAVEFYFQAREAARLPDGTYPAVSFTGHSLGGGLASILSVWLNVPAVTIASAPFERAALSDDVMRRVWDAVPALRTAYGNNFDGFSGNVALQFAQRETNVRNLYIGGELNSVSPVSDNPGIAAPLGPTGSQRIGLNASTVSSTRLHSSRLHAAAVLAPGLENVSVRNATLIEEMVPVQGSPQSATATTFMTRVLNDQVARVLADAANGLLVPVLADDESHDSTCERGADVSFAGAITSGCRFAADCVGSVG